MESIKHASSFRMPNSIVQGLTTATSAELHRLNAFQIVVLFGLMAHLNAKHPEREVRIKVRDILEIIRVGKAVKHVVDRVWTTADGTENCKQYSCRRFSPKHIERVHDALLELFDQSVMIHSAGDTKKHTTINRVVHILDSFGYCFRVRGETVDLDDLPHDMEKDNVGSDERPVWRIRRRGTAGGRFEPPVCISYRLNTELAAELRNHRGTIGFTIFARRVFELFRELANNPAAIRLLILILRQTGTQFIRVLRPLLCDLGLDSNHPTRAVDQLTSLLERFRGMGVVTEFTVDLANDRVGITTSDEWRETP